jgi:tetratricopeptide (TPR) repeat protein
LRAEVQVELGRVVYGQGDMAGAGELLRQPAASEFLDTSARAFFLLTVIECHLGALFEDGERAISQRLAAAEEHGADDRTLAEGHLAHAQLLFWNGRTAELVDTGRRALAHAIGAGDALLEADALSKIGIGMFYGTATWAEAEQQARASLQEAGRLGQAMLGARQGLAGTAAAQGRFEEARELYRQHRATLEERGLSLQLVSYGQNPAFAEILAGDYERAEVHARLAWDGLGRIGEHGYRSTTGAILAEALAGQGRLEEARAILDETDTITAEDDWLTIAHCNWARALIALGSGDHDRAVEHARRSTEVADSREYFNLRTYYWIGLGRVLVETGRDDEARDALAEAQRLANIKQSDLDQDRIRELVDRLAVPD